MVVAAVEEAMGVPVEKAVEDSEDWVVVMEED